MDCGGGQVVSYAVDALDDVRVVITDSKGRVYKGHLALICDRLWLDLPGWPDELWSVAVRLGRSVWPASR